MSTPTAMLPTGSHPKTKPNGDAYGVNDKEFHELEKDGGIRRYQYLAYPAMRYRGLDDPATGKATTEQRIVQSEREDDEAQAAGWHKSPALALEAHENAHRAVAESAARAAHQAERLTEPARREYRKRSATTEDHVTE